MYDNPPDSTLVQYLIEEGLRSSRVIISVYKNERSIGSFLFEEDDIHLKEEIIKLFETENVRRREEDRKRIERVREAKKAQ